MGEKLSSRQVRELFRLTENALAMRIRRGQFPAPCERRPHGQRVRCYWDSSDLEAYIQSNFLFCKVSVFTASADADGDKA